MTMWTRDELSTIGSADEVRIAPLRKNGSMPKSVTIWIVRVGDDLYVRSAYGRDSSWFRGAQEHHKGTIHVGSLTKDVIFIDADPKLSNEVDGAYRTKYRSHGETYVNMMVSQTACSATIKIVPNSPRR
jgi:hypothetical protein